MEVDEPQVEEDQHQEAELEVALCPDKEVVLGGKPRKEDEVVVKVAEEVVQFLGHVPLPLLHVFFEHLLILLLGDRHALNVLMLEVCDATLALGLRV